MGPSQEHRRQQAIARYLAGDNIEAICRDLHCAKSWLYKWKARYQADNPAWTTGRSTQPKRTPSHATSLRRERLRASAAAASASSTSPPKSTAEKSPAESPWPRAW